MQEQFACNAAHCGIKGALVKLLLVNLLIAVPSFAQQTTIPIVQSACGQPDARFDISKRPSQSGENLASPTIATVVLVTKAVGFYSGCGQVVRIGVDGKWAGALCLGQHTVLNLAPGDHHLCVDLQSKATPAYTSLHSLHAEGGKIYFFGATVSVAYHQDFSIHLKPMDKDEGALRFATSVAATSKPK